MVSVVEEPLARLLCNRPFGRHYLSVSFPQRLCNPRFSAVAVLSFLQHLCYRLSARHCFSIALLQRQQIPRFSAVAVLSFLQHLCYRLSARHCFSIALPQRQQIQRFSAIADMIAEVIADVCCAAAETWTKCRFCKKITRRMRFLADFPG